MPGVIAQTDSRVASYSIGDISKFSGCISKNCAQSLIAPVTQVTKAVPNTTVAIPAVTVQPTAAQAATKSAVTAATAAKAKATVKPTAAQTTKAAGRPVAEASGSRTQTRKQYDIVSYDYDDEDYGYSYDDNDDYSYSDSYNYGDSYSYNDDYDDDDGYSYDDYDYDYQYSYAGDYNDDDNYSSATQSTTQAESRSQSSYSSYSSNALIAIANPDYSYSPSHVSLSSYDRAKLERLVMGEAGTMGYTGCAVVAQAIRDSMNRSNTSSIDRIISEYQYFGSTNVAPNSDVKAAVSFIFDQDGIAVQHRVMCFYIGYSPWHETQTFLTEIDGVRFFDLNVA